MGNEHPLEIGRDRENNVARMIAYHAGKSRGNLKMKYQVLYSNEERRESTPPFNTREEAQESADFLKFQGAKRIKIKEI